MSRKKKAVIAVSAALAGLILLITFILVFDVVTVGISSRDGSLWIGSSTYAKEGNIYLVGESHAKEPILAEELRLWQDFYHNEGMRHFFIEYGYSTAERINLWMQSDSDEILDEVFKGFSGTNSDSIHVYNFYKEIKRTCPETIFHGTDVTSGTTKYISYLEAAGKKDTEEYHLALEGREQFLRYTGDGNKDYDYREATMAENFIREYEKLGGLSIFGVYGSAHTLYPAYGYRAKDTVTMTTTIVRTYGRDAVEVNNLTQAYESGELRGKLP